MEAPKLTGFTKDRPRLRANARAAAQDITKPDIVELSDIRAKIEAAGQDADQLDGGGRRLQSQVGHSDAQRRYLADRRPATRCSLDRSGGRHHRRATSCRTSRSGEDAARHASTPSGWKSTNGGEVVRFDRRCEDDAGQYAGSRRATGRRSTAMITVRSLHCGCCRPRAGAGRGAAGAARRRSQRARRAQRAAGLFAEPRQAGADRSGYARGARQGQDGDLHRQREGRAGRHHMRCKSLVVFYDNKARPAA